MYDKLVERSLPDKEAEVCPVCRGGVQALHQHVTPVPGHLLQNVQAYTHCKKGY